jgi:hypothetical protein
MCICVSGRDTRLFGVHIWGVMTLQVADSSEILLSVYKTEARERSGYNIQGVLMTQVADSSEIFQYPYKTKTR